MIKKNLLFIFLAMCGGSNLFAENETKEKPYKQEQKIESNNARLAKGIAAGLGAAACAYLDALILNWIHNYGQPTNFIQKNFIDKIGLYFFKKMKIKGFTFGIPDAKLLISALLGIPSGILGLYLTKIAIDELRSFINIKRKNSERLNE